MYVTVAITTACIITEASEYVGPATAGPIFMALSALPYLIFRGA